MRLVAVLVMLACAMAPAARADEAFIGPLAAQAHLFDIGSIEGGGQLAVGERGIILQRENGEWQQQPSPVDVSLLRVVTRGDRQWILGHEATLLSRTGDEPWRVQRQQQGADRPLFDLAFVDDRRAFAVGAYGLMLASEDGGQQWQPRQLVTLLEAEDQRYLAELRAEDEAAYEDELATIMPHFNAIAAHGQRLALAGEAGLLAISDDAGNTWRRIESPYPGSFFSVRWLDDDSLAVAGLRGHLFRVTPSDGQWQAWELPGTRHVNRIERLAADRLLALTNGGGVFILDLTSGKQRSLYVAERPDLYAALIEGDMLQLATSAGLQSLSFPALER